MKRSNRLWITGVAVVAVATAGLGIGNAMAEDSDANAAPQAEKIHYQSYFNEPTKHNGHDNKLRDKLVAYINGAPKGSAIRAHITQLSKGKSMLVVRDALLEADKRGVKIKMVNDGGSKVHSKLTKALGKNYVHCGTPAVDNDACVSGVKGGRHHLKNWYFSDTKPNDTRYHHMVLVTSYNITKSQAEHFNDMTVISGDKALYKAHAKYFDEDYFAQRKTDDRYNEPGGQIAVDSAPGFTAAFTPQKSGDLVADAFKKVEFEKGCQLRVANLSLNRQAVVDQLLRVKKIGCKVLVVTDTELESKHRKAFDAAGIEFRNAPIHNKMTVLNGGYDGKKDTVRIWTGSHNFSTGPLRYRDDVFVSYSQRDMYARYGDHFETIWNAGR